MPCGCPDCLTASSSSWCSGAVWSRCLAAHMAAPALPGGGPVPVTDGLSLALLRLLDSCRATAAAAVAAQVAAFSAVRIAARSSGVFEASHARCWSMPCVTAAMMTATTGVMMLARIIRTPQTMKPVPVEAPLPGWPSATRAIPALRASAQDTPQMASLWPLAGARSCRPPGAFYPSVSRGGGGDAGLA